MKKKINVRAKGHSFERKIANELKSIFPQCGRKLEYQADEATGVDLKNTGEYKFQLKAYKSYAPISKIEEIKDSGIPVLLTKGDNKEVMAVLPWRYLIELIRLNEVKKLFD